MHPPPPVDGNTAPRAVEAGMFHCHGDRKGVPASWAHAYIRAAHSVSNMKMYVYLLFLPEKKQNSNMIEKCIWFDMSSVSRVAENSQAIREIHVTWFVVLSSTLKRGPGSRRCFIADLGFLCDQPCTHKAYEIVDVDALNSSFKESLMSWDCWPGRLVRDLLRTRVNAGRRECCNVLIDCL